MSTRTCRRPRSTPALQAYLQDIDGVALLDRREEGELADRIAQGDPHARDRMIRANLRLVVHLARKYRGQGLPLEDLIAEGNLGLIRAVEGYDGRAEVRFSTYASFWIRQAIRRALMNQGKMIRLPAYAVTLLVKWRRASALLADRLGRAPTPEEVAEALRLPEQKRAIAAEILEASGLTRNHDDTGEDGDGPVALLTDDRGKTAEDALIEADDLERIWAGLEALEGREATVLRMRFGLEPYAPLTLKEAGQILGLTRARVQQIEKEALRKLIAGLGEPTRGGAAAYAIAG